MGCKLLEGQHKQVKQKNEDLELELELEAAHARIRDLKQRLYGKKTESGIGISVWREVLLNKFLFSRALNNLCTDYTHPPWSTYCPWYTHGRITEDSATVRTALNELVKKQLTEDVEPFEVAVTERFCA